MTVRELMEMLSNLPQDAQVLVFDSEYGCGLPHVEVEKDREEVDVVFSME